MKTVSTTKGSPAPGPAPGERSPGRDEPPGASPGPGHFGFFRGPGPGGAEPYAGYLERHLRNEHDRDRELDEIPFGYSRRDRIERHAALDALHHRSHEEELAHCQEAENRYPDLAGHTQRRREELESQHQPYADEERERQEDEQREIREHRENAVVLLHGRDSTLEEMEQHLRAVHGRPEASLPEYRLPTFRGQDSYAEALQQEHSIDHGEAGTYRHGDDDRAIVIHGALMSPYDAESHLAQLHGSDQDELRHSEYPPGELAAMHVQDHQNHPGRHTEEEFRRDHGLEHDRHLRYSSDEEGETAGIVPEHYSHVCDWDKLKAPSEHDTDCGTAARWVPPPPYMPVPSGPDALLGHMAGEHAVRQSPRPAKLPAEEFLSSVHARIHAGELPDHGGGTHQHDNPPARRPPDLASLLATAASSAAPAPVTGPGLFPAGRAPAGSRAPGGRAPNAEVPGTRTSGARGAPPRVP